MSDSDSDSDYISPNRFEKINNVIEKITPYTFVSLFIFFPVLFIPNNISIFFLESVIVYSIFYSFVPNLNVLRWILVGIHTLFVGMTFVIPLIFYFIKNDKTMSIDKVQSATIIDYFLFVICVLIALVEEYKYILLKANLWKKFKFISTIILIGPVTYLIYHKSSNSKNISNSRWNKIVIIMSILFFSLYYLYGEKESTSNILTYYSTLLVAFCTFPGLDYYSLSKYFDESTKKLNNRQEDLGHWKIYFIIVCFSTFMTNPLFLCFCVYMICDFDKIPYNQTLDEDLETEVILLKSLPEIQNSSYLINLNNWKNTIFLYSIVASSLVCIWPFIFTSKYLPCLAIWHTFTEFFSIIHLLFLSDGSSKTQNNLKYGWYWFYGACILLNIFMFIYIQYADTIFFLSFFIVDSFSFFTSFTILYKLEFKNTSINFILLFFGLHGFVICFIVVISVFITSQDILYQFLLIFIVLPFQILSFRQFLKQKNKNIQIQINNGLILIIMFVSLIFTTVIISLFQYFKNIFEKNSLETQHVSIYVMPTIGILSLFLTLYDVYSSV
jgi:hypothetical protein